MVKQVTGVLANDGTFFEHAAEAEEYEANIALNTALAKEHIHADRFMSLVVRLWPLITRWIDARTETSQQSQDAGKPYDSVGRDFDSSQRPQSIEQEINELEAEQQLIDEFTERTGFDPRIKRSPEEVVETLQQLALGSGEPMRPVGRGIGAETISDEDEEPAPGMWRGDASGVRGG